MVRTRLRARLQGWQLYRIGADLATLPGKTCDATLELLAQRLVTSALSNSFLPSGSFRVQTTRSGGKLDIYVYLSNSLLAQAALDTTSGASHLPGRETQLVQEVSIRHSHQVSLSMGEAKIPARAKLSALITAPPRARLPAPDVRCRARPARASAVSDSSSVRCWPARRHGRVP